MPTALSEPEGRYADNLVVGFAHVSDAVRLRTELEQRLDRFGLKPNADLRCATTTSEFLAVKQEEE